MSKVPRLPNNILLKIIQIAHYEEIVGITGYVDDEAEWRDHYYCAAAWRRIEWAIIHAEYHFGEEIIL